MWRQKGWGWWVRQKEPKRKAFASLFFPRFSWQNQHSHVFCIFEISDVGAEIWCVFGGSGMGWKLLLVLHVYPLNHHIFIIVLPFNKISFATGKWSLPAIASFSFFQLFQLRGESGEKVNQANQVTQVKQMNQVNQVRQVNQVKQVHCRRKGYI